MKYRLTKRLTSLGLLILAATSLRAATITVTSTDDAGGICPGASCTLRQAIATAAPGDTINFAAGITTITLTSAELLVTRDLTITGAGANLLTVRRNIALLTPEFRVFDIGASSIIVTISGLTISQGVVPFGGSSGSGGGIKNFGKLTLTNCTVSGNRSLASGGGIDNTGTLTITNCTISGNSAEGDGGVGGGISNNKTVVMTNSTISGNITTADGGGLYSVQGVVTITNSTIAGNTGSRGGGIVIAGGTVNARNTIIAENTAATSPDISGTLTSQGFDLIGDTDGSSIESPPGTIGNQLNVDPLLGNLNDNGGPTRTRALLSGSPAIEAGDSGGSNVDQRGLARPVDSPAIANVGDGSDIGAYEVQADLLPGCSNINSIVNNNNDSGEDSLRGVIASVCAGTTITFASNVTGAINLTSGELLLDKSVTINGPGAGLLSVQRSAAAGEFRIFNITPNQVIATISGLDIANGNSPSNGGGISSTGVLTIADCAISGNTTGSSGGGLVSSGPLTIRNSTIAANSATGGSGGGLLISGTADITNSTISGNSASEFSVGIGFGGGIHISAGTVTLTNSTIASNSAQFRGGGIINSSGTLRSRNTIIALNTAGTGGGPDIFGPLLSEGFNLIGNNSDASITPAQFSDQIGTAGAAIDPLLGPLQNNGGPTLTLPLLVDSPAIDKGNSSGSTTDQRGFARPVDLPEIANINDGDGADIGAFETQLDTPTPTPTTLANISTRLSVGTGDNVLIGGFIVTGTEPKKVIVRAIGPSLAVAGKLANPTLELYDSAGLLVSNDDWKTTQQGEIEATGLQPSNDLESAIVTTLPANNLAYTAILRGANNSTGVGLVEVYDLDQTVDSKLANISTRGLIQTGDNVIIGGLIVLGAEPLDVIIRALGPSLPLTGKLGNPILELHDGNGALLVSNDNWRSDQETEIIASNLAPTDDMESAILRTLLPGAYTAIVRGVAGSTGIALVEVYALGP